MAYRENDTKKWTAQWYEMDIVGKKHKKKKRGFNTKKEALEFEMQKKLAMNRSLDMVLSEFAEIYYEDKKSELKERTLVNKRYMIDQHIIPYFGKLKMNEITAAQVLQWQAEILKKGYSDTYLRMIQNQLTSLFTHASKVYDLKDNPCKKVKKIGKSDANRIDFWTNDEFQKFIKTIEEESMYYTLFQILYWSGCRIGEALSLTKKDIDLKNNKIKITKTFYRRKGKDVITSPKTEESIREIDISEALKEIIMKYINRIYGLPDDERLFPVGQEAVQHKMKRNIEKANVKKIRVHDLRHSHVAYLINKEVDPLIIKERLGHKDIRITLNTYGHLYPSKQKSVVDMLNEDIKKCSGKND